MTPSVPGYRIDRPLGTGSQGQVYAARSERSGERVALKRIPINPAETPDPAQALRRARSEAALLTELEHPNLIQLIELVLVGGAAVLVLELAEGGSLADRLDRSTTLLPVEVAAILSPIAAALAHAHDRGVLHSDLSPANVLFTGTGQPKLADLGIARLVGADCDALGTLDYLDPVVAAGGVAGPASDVFSLGAVALRALTGSGPCRYSGAGGGAADLAVTGGDFADDLDRRLRQLPGQLGPVLKRVLDPRPNRRGTAAQLSLDLHLAAESARSAITVGRHSEEYAAARLPALDVSGASRVGAVGAAPPAAQLTHLSRPRIRPAPAACTRRFDRVRRKLGKPRVSGLRTTGWRTAGRPSRAAALSFAVALLGILATTLLLVVAAPHRIRQATAATEATAPTPTGQSAARSAAPSRPPSDRASQGQAKLSRTSSGSALSDQPPAKVLATLAALRIEAYQLRRPELLAQVYLPGQLLTQDTAQLTRLIPAGCRLADLRGGYSDITVSVASVPRIEARVVATLGGAELLCGSVLRGRTPAVSQTLQVVLVRTDAGYRIADQHGAAPGSS